jgi:hypothetical protein
MLVSAYRVSERTVGERFKPGRLATKRQSAILQGRRQVNRGDERPLLVETWLGNTVFVEYMGGQPLEGEVLRRIAAEDSTADTPQRVKTSFLVLENYNQYGIEVRFRGDAEPHFLPWGAILRMAEAEGGTPENSEEAPSQRTEPRDRGELMARLVDARTPSELAGARATADDWLAANPGDGDVRLARERLGVEPEEDLDLEEGSPT